MKKNTIEETIDKIITHDIANKQLTTFSTSRSGGPGGQHANKVETKVTLTYKYQKSRFLSQQQKEQLATLLHKTYINKEQCIQLHCKKTRSQHSNKQGVIAQLRKKLIELLQPIIDRDALPATKKGKAITKKAKKQRKQQKMHTSKKKQQRKRPSPLD